MKLLPPSLEPWKPERDRKAIAVLMSGGVDSSVTAMLLKQAGWQVLGLTMKVPVAPRCSSPDAACCGADAALICHELGISHYYVEVDQEFEEQVIRRFRSAYLGGRTPNPCIDCNKFLKFGHLWDVAEREFGVGCLATGHYARVRQTAGGSSVLMRGEDAGRDQSYFIYGVPRERLPFFVLPMGDLNKDAVRELAVRNGLSVARKPDSMELCFAGEGDYRNALDLPETRPGEIRHVDGRLLGRHDGIWNYTVGQRRGLNIGGGTPLYVIRVDMDTDTVVVGEREHAFSKRVTAQAPNILVPEQFMPGRRFDGKIRSYNRAASCTLTAAGPDEFTVGFDEAQFAPAPGQHLVLYDGDVVIAGGEIA